MLTLFWQMYLLQWDTWLIGYRWRFHVCLWSTELFKDFPFKPKDNTRFSTFKTHDCMKDEGCYYMGSGTRQLTLLYVNVCILHLMTVDAALPHVLCADYAIISKDYNIAQSKRFCCSSFWWRLRWGFSFGNLTIAMAQSAVASERGYCGWVILWHT